jgi:hypothetical protein
MDSIILKPDIKSIKKYTNFNVSVYGLLTDEDFKIEHVFEYLGQESAKDLLASQSEYNEFITLANDWYVEGVDDRLIHNLLFLINHICSSEIPNNELITRRIKRNLPRIHNLAEINFYNVLKEFSIIHKDFNKERNQLCTNKKIIDDILNNDEYSEYKIVVRKQKGKKYINVLDLNKTSIIEKILISIKKEIYSRIDKLNFEDNTSEQESLLKRLSFNIHNYIQNCFPLKITDSLFLTGIVLANCGMLPTESEYNTEANKKSTPTSYKEYLYKLLPEIIK